MTITSIFFSFAFMVFSYMLKLAGIWFWKVPEWKYLSDQRRLFNPTRLNL
jgi:hypothetical protein